VSSPSSIIVKAKKLQRIAKKIGFDWKNASQTLGKVYEELGELKKAIKKDDKRNIVEEYGDLLFSIINLSRHLEINSEIALKIANNKFERRFKKLQDIIVKRKLIKKPYSIPITTLEKIWDNVKSKEKK